MAASEIDPFTQYHRFVGTFITQFAELESHLRWMLMVRTGMTRQMFDIIVGFPRTADAIKKMRQILARSRLDTESKEAVEDAFKQLAVITLLRDRIVHYGGHPMEGDQFLIRTKPTDTSQATGGAFDLFERQQLWNATIDLNLISFVLRFRLDDGLPDDFRTTLGVNAVRRAPWRYIPPQQPRGRQ